MKENKEEKIEKKDYVWNLVVELHCTVAIAILMSGSRGRLEFGSLKNSAIVVFRLATQPAI